MMMDSRCVVLATVLALSLGAPGATQQKTVSDDKDWSKPAASLKDTREAEFLIRVGDVDNLGFGWPDGFDPFCGRLTEAHEYPWEPNRADQPGFDRILLSSRFNPAEPKGCGGDGYSAAYDAVTSKPVAYTIPTAALQGATVANAFVQVFIDDFQAPSICSQFQVTLNGVRCAECEKIFNAIDQTGPVGKLITIPLPEEFYGALTSKASLTLTIDEVTGAADGFAVDFVRLLVNRRRVNACTGTVNGVVLEKDTEQPIAKARVSLADRTGAQTDAAGRFTLKGVPTGFEVVGASAPGYNDGAGTADIGPGEDNPPVTIYLEKGKQAVFDQKRIAVGEAISLSNILFDLGKAEIKAASTPELDKVVAFMTSNPGAEIELSGHTSSEGDAALNRSLSYRRVKACKDYIVSRGIDPGRIIAQGYGPDRPVAPNDTEANRARNRRVEMRVVKL
jgi:outer membrane protein OmpA-like peptidoglycan-associated protein